MHIPPRHGSPPQFVKKEEGMRSCHSYHLVQMEEMAGEGAEVLFDILLIPDHCKDILKNGRMASL